MNGEPVAQYKYGGIRATVFRGGGIGIENGSHALVYFTDADEMTRWLASLKRVTDRAKTASKERVATGES